MSTFAPGALLAGYRIEHLLGEGGMGEVYCATQLNLERPVALKVMHPGRGPQTDALARFAREAKVGAQLKHAGAVEIYDYGSADGVAYIAMEILRGTTLRALVGEEEALLPIERVVRLTRQLTSVLVAAHDLGIIHRDLKPENVFLERAADGGDRIVVVDFGLAFIDQREGMGRMTQEGTITGTPDYLSPEQAQGMGVDKPTDVYALGCMLYEMLTTMVPFRGHYMHVLTQQLYAAPTPPSEVRRDLVIPRDLEALVMQMLRKEPQLRPTMLALRDAFAAMVPGRGERAREHLATEGRVARMLSTYRPPPGPLTAAERPTMDPRDARAVMDDPKQMAVVGELAGDLVLGLGANDLLPYIVSVDAPVAGADVIFAPGATPETLTALAKHGIPLLSDAAPTDMPRIAMLLKLGVDEVVVTPVVVEELARKTWRAIRKKKRAGRHRPA